MWNYTQNYSSLPALSPGYLSPSLSLCRIANKKPTSMTDPMVFDGVAAAKMMKELQSSFATGRTTSYQWRVTQLKAMHRMLEEREREMVEALRLDLNKPEYESILYEIVVLKNNCEEAARELKQWMKPEKVKTSLITFPSSAEIVTDPLGVVLVVGTWNYPLATALDPVIGAIAAGNAVVLKPSEVAPASSSVLAKYMKEYMDNSAIRVVEGTVAETTTLLEQRWDKIFYTGNGRVGRIVMAAAVKHLTPVILELGGKCPVIVDSDVNLNVAVRRIVAGKWGYNNGQTCIAADHIITTTDFAPKLVEAMKQCIEDFFGADPLSSKDISCIVSPSHFDRLSRLLDDDKASSKIIYGGQRDKAQLKIAPTILVDVHEDAMVMNEEIFGPLFPIVTVERVEESFELVKSRPKPLAAYLFTNNKRLMDEFVHKIYAGGICINDIVLHVLTPTLPFGGVGESGMGAYHGKYSFEAFSHKKSVMYKSFMGDSSARYPPYTPWKLQLVKAIVTGSLLGVLKALFGFSDHSDSHKARQGIDNDLKLISHKNKKPYMMLHFSSLLKARESKVGFSFPSIIGAARGLAFLHQEEKPVIFHDVKAANILLSPVSSQISAAKLSDFGFATDGPEDDKTHVSTQNILGTEGYVAPEYHMTGHLTTMSDVYSFRVVLLELLTGRRCIDKSRPQREHSLVEWVRPHLRDTQRLGAIMDRRLEGQYSAEGAKVAAMLAYQCLSHQAKCRPKMGNVAKTFTTVLDMKDDIMMPFVYIAPCETNKQFSDQKEKAETARRHRAGRERRSRVAHSDTEW